MPAEVLKFYSGSVAIRNWDGPNPGKKTNMQVPAMTVVNNILTTASCCPSFVNAECVGAPTPTEDIHATFTCVTTAAGENCTATCNEGFRPSPTDAAPRALCLGQSRFDAIVGSCVPIGECDHLTVSNFDRLLCISAH